MIPAAIIGAAVLLLVAHVLRAAVRRRQRTWMDVADEIDRDE